MTDLQLYSLIGGGAIVAVVYAFNWWQEYRYRKEANRAFARNQPDVLLDTPKNMVRTGETHRLEPMLDQPVKRPEPRLEPQLEAAAPVTRFEEDDDREILGHDDIPPLPHGLRFNAPEPAPRALAPIEILADDDDAEEDESSEAGVLATSLLDPALDFVAEVHAGERIAAKDVPPFPGAKRVVAIGRNDDDQWEVVSAHSKANYTELRVALQLADRQGPLSQEQLNAFCMSVQQFADANDAFVTFPQRSGKLGAAKELDEFCAVVDVLIGLNIFAGGKPFAMEQVRALAENAGLVRGTDGNFVYRSDSGKTLFTLANHDETPFGMTSTGLTLLFDVPRVAGGMSVFDYLTEFSQSLAAALGAELVDDNGKAITETSLANIRKQLGAIYSKMDDRGIAAGSVAALRLFA